MSEHEHEWYIEGCAHIQGIFVRCFECEEKLDRKEIDTIINNPIVKPIIDTLMGRRNDE